MGSAAMATRMASICSTEGHQRCSSGPLRVVYLGAGLFPNEGVQLLALAAADGAPRWQRDVRFSPQGYLVSSPMGTLKQELERGTPGGGPGKSRVPRPSSDLGVRREQDTLKPERTVSGEVVYEHRFSEVAAVSASAFFNGYSDLIRFVTVPAPGLGRPPDPANPADYRQQAVNVGDFGVIGGEIGFRLRWKPWLQAYGGVSFQWTGEVGQVNFPGVTGNLALSSRGLWHPLILAVNLAFGSARDKDPATVLPGTPASVPAYLVLNAAATFEVPGTRTLGIQLGMTNITGTRAPHPVPGEFTPITEIPEAPRTLRLTLRYRFE